MIHLYKEEVAINKKDIEIPSILEIIDTLPKEDYTKVILYIFLTEDRSNDNPIKDLQHSIRKRKAKEIVFGDANFNFWKTYAKYTDLITRAIADYSAESIDKIQKDIDLYDNKMYQFKELLDNTEPEIIKNTHELSGRVTFSTNIDILTVILDNIINIIIDKNKLVTMQKTGKFDGRLRGRLSPNTKGKLNIKTETK